MVALPPINKKHALEWLQGLKACMQGYKWWLSSGTLLGAVREGNFIDWDVDIDCMMLRKYEGDFQKIVKCLRARGFTANYVICKDLRPEIKELQHFIQINYKGVPGHIGVRSPKRLFPELSSRSPKNYKTKNCLTSFKTATIQGVEFPIPNNVEKLLTEMYGDWRTPQIPPSMKNVISHIRRPGHPVPEGLWHD